MNEVYTDDFIPVSPIIHNILDDIGIPHCSDEHIKTTRYLLHMVKNCPHLPSECLRCMAGAYCDGLKCQK